MDDYYNDNSMDFDDKPKTIEFKKNHPDWVRLNPKFSRDESEPNGWYDRLWHYYAYLRGDAANDLAFGEISQGDGWLVAWDFDSTVLLANPEMAAQLIMAVK